MKVLFAVSNEKISKSIISTYQKKYKEIISSKNVYYFNAIQKELQKDNTYDRIVISEDLEPFTNNNFDTIDRFIFDKLDAISDEATNSKRNDTPIILICSDRRTKSEEMLVKLFSIGVYDAILGSDRSIDEITNLIRKPRTKKEAKLYYNIDTEDVKYSHEDDNEVSEAEIQNILNYYKKLGKNEDKYVEVFESVASQYNEEQLKVIANVLPLNVKVVLETRSPVYQKAMTSSVGEYVNRQNDDSGLSMNFINDKSKPTSGNIIVPSAINKGKIKKIQTERPVISTPEDKNVPDIEIPDVDVPEVEVPEFDNNIENESVKVEEVAPVKRGRGRPRKNPLPTDEVKSATPKKRGRPRKNPLPEAEETVNLFEISNEEAPKENNTFERIENKNFSSIEDSINEGLDGFLPGLEPENSHSDVLPGLESNNIFEQKVEPVQSDANVYTRNQGYVPDNTTKEIVNNKSIVTTNVQNLLIRNKKLVAFLGTSKNGTSFIVNNVAELVSSYGVNTAILDLTHNRNAYYIYTQNEENLRNVAAGSIKNLQLGIAQGIRVKNNLTVYTGIPEEQVGIENYGKVLETLVSNYDLVLMDCDFTTPYGYFYEAQETYLIQSLDVLTIQPLTAFLRDLKAKDVLKQEKLRIVINKKMKVRELTDKAIIGGMSFYNEPSMSFMTELFNKDTIRYCSIPFEEQTYSKYLEGLVNCKITTKGYSKMFMQALSELTNMVYPLIGGKTQKNNRNNMNNNGFTQIDSLEPQRFSQGMNDTLNQMKKNF